jgi:hypothetical protein
VIKLMLFTTHMLGSNAAAVVVAARHVMDTLRMAMAKAFEELMHVLEDERRFAAFGKTHLMHCHQHALAPPLGHNPTLTSASALRHCWLSSRQSRHATCWQTRAWMTVGCLDAHAPEEATTTAHGARS